MSHEVLISYSHRDRQFADRLTDSLEHEKINCWIAPRDVVAGKDWAEEIVSAIETSKALVLLFSAASNESAQVKREAHQAVSLGVPLVPIRLENVPPNKAMSYYLGPTHWIDAFENGTNSHLLAIVSAIRTLLNLQQSSSCSTEAKATLLDEAIRQVTVLLRDVDVVLGRMQEERGKEAVRLIRSKVLAVLPRLDGNEKRELIGFLYNTSLIRRSSGGHGGSVLDLSGADLRGMNFARASFPRIELYNTDLTNADFSGADLQDAELYSATCKGAKFDGANLKGVRFSHYEIVGDNLDFSLLRSLGASGVRPD